MDPRMQHAAWCAVMAVVVAVAVVPLRARLPTGFHPASAARWVLFTICSMLLANVRHGESPKRGCLFKDQTVPNLNACAKSLPRPLPPPQPPTARRTAHANTRSSMLCKEAGKAWARAYGVCGTHPLVWSRLDGGLRSGHRSQRVREGAA